jgi:two-component system, OmpR family, phosphate regulon sensor histidine kinase PhoR
MKLSAPKNMAVFLSVLIALLTGSLALIFVFYGSSGFLELWIVYELSVFLIFYIIIYYALNNFIIQKIRPIYKTIHNVTIPDREIREKLEDKDIIAVVNQEVREWASIKTKEISQLRQMERYRKEFLGNVSHELKTPIFNIQGYISTLLEGGLEDPEINRKYLERSEKSISRLIAIVNDLETISSLESQDFRLEFSEFDLVLLIHEVFDMYEDTVSERMMSLILKEPPSPEILVFANREKIFEVLSNLVNNSIKYGKPEGKIWIEILDMDHHYLIEVEDDGIGIAEPDLPRIFERFYRTDKSRSREMGGSGLGLAIVKHIIEAHRQTIHCRSTLGKGTSFTFTLKKAIH